MPDDYYIEPIVFTEFLLSRRKNITRNDNNNNIITARITYYTSAKMSYTRSNGYASLIYTDCRSHAQVCENVTDSRHFNYLSFNNNNIESEYYCYCYSVML